MALGAGWQSSRRDGGTDEHDGLELAEARAEKGWAATSRKYRSVGKREVMEQLSLAMDVSCDGALLLFCLMREISFIVRTWPPP